MVTVDEGKCIGCGLCVSDCTFENITIHNGKAHIEKPCMQCGHCVALCPTDAISIPDYDMSDVEEFEKERFGFDIERLLYTIKARRSIRNYEERPVEKEKLEKIFQAGRYTATGVNRQDCRFVIVQDGIQKLKKMIWDGVEYAMNNPDIASEGMRAAYRNVAEKRTRGVDFLFRNAPAVIYIAADGPQSACLAAQNMELAAISQGLGILYNGYLLGATNMNQEVCKWLDLTDKHAQICMLVGYPDIEYKRTAPRREADVRWR